MNTNDAVEIARGGDLIHIRYAASPGGKTVELWFDADNAHWVLENFETFVTTYRHPGIERVERGGDCFTISGGGSDLEPVYFLQNRRSKQVDNAGNYSLPLGEEPAYELIEELTELRREITT
jgi:hypothetical protein